jgi:hypothetical protein
VVHGPGVRFGADHLARGRQLGLAVSPQYQFPGRHADERVELELRTLALRADLRALGTELVPGSGLGGSLGVGLDVTWLAPKARDQSGFVAESDDTSLVPLAAANLLWQLRLTPLARLELGLGLELDLVSVHYDIVEMRGTERFVSRWPARPAATLAVEFL